MQDWQDSKSQKIKGVARMARDLDLRLECYAPGDGLRRWYLVRVEDVEGSGERVFQSHKMDEINAFLFGVNWKYWEEKNNV